MGCILQTKLPATPGFGGLGEHWLSFMFYEKRALCIMHQQTVFQAHFCNHCPVADKSLKTILCPSRISKVLHSCLTTSCLLQENASVSLSVFPADLDWDNFVEDHFRTHSALESCFLLPKFTARRHFPATFRSKQECRALLVLRLLSGYRHVRCLPFHHGRSKR